MVTKKLRAFLGVPIPSPLRERLSRLQQDLRERLPSRRWVDPGSFHLTLKFLGSIDPGRTSEILDAIAPVARRRSPFVCRVRGLGVFPSALAPRVVWAGVEARGAALETWVGELDTALEALGFPSEKRAYHPHLTLSRGSSRGQADQATVSAVLEDRAILEACQDLGPLPVEAILLYRSDSDASGPRYTPLARVPLGENAGSPDGNGVEGASLTSDRVEDP